VGWRDVGPFPIGTRVAVILEVELDDLNCEAERLPRDLRDEIKAVVRLYRRRGDTAGPKDKP
jgi:HTH-type transcriptional regulator, competence development regulator